MDAWISAVAALLGAFGGVLLTRSWKRRDESRARRRDWVIEVLARLDALEEAVFWGQPVPSNGMVFVVVAADLEVDEPSATTIARYVTNTTMGLVVQYGKVAKPNDHGREANDARDAWIAGILEARTVVARWARRDPRVNRFYLRRKQRVRNYTRHPSTSS